METDRRRLLTGLAAGGVLAAALTGGGVAIAATDSAPAAPAAATGAVLAAPGTPGSPASARSVTASAGRHAGAAFRRFARRHPHVVRSAFRSAAAYLGLTPAQLRAQLRDGKSLAQVAAAKGKPVQGLENAILAGAVKAIDAHTGWTAARKAAVTARVKNHLNAVVNATFPYGIGGHKEAPAAGDRRGVAARREVSDVPAGRRAPETCAAPSAGELAEFGQDFLADHLDRRHRVGGHDLDGDDVRADVGDQRAVGVDQALRRRGRPCSWPAPRRGPSRRP